MDFLFQSSCHFKENSSLHATFGVTFRVTRTFLSAAFATNAPLLIV